MVDSSEIKVPKGVEAWRAPHGEVSQAMPSVERSLPTNPSELAEAAINNFPPGAAKEVRGRLFGRMKELEGLKNVALSDGHKKNYEAVSNALSVLAQKLDIDNPNIVPLNTEEKSDLIEVLSASTVNDLLKRAKDKIGWI